MDDGGFLVFGFALLARPEARSLSSGWLTRSLALSLYPSNVYYLI
jgi:hypothetical protein